MKQLQRIAALLSFMVCFGIATSVSATPARFGAGVGFGFSFLDEQDSGDIDNAVGIDLQLSGHLGLNETVFLGAYFNWMTATHHPEVNNDVDVQASLSAFGASLRLELSQVDIEVLLGYAFGELELSAGGPLSTSLDYGGFQFGGAVYYPIAIASNTDIDIGVFMLGNALTDREDGVDSEGTLIHLGLMAKVVFGANF